MFSAKRLSIVVTLGVLFGATTCWGQTSTSSEGSQGLRPISSSVPSTSAPVMVPLNPTHSYGFDPYAATPGVVDGYGSLSGAMMSQPSLILPPTTAYQPPSSPTTVSPYNSSINPALTTPGAITPGLPSTGVPSMGSPYVAPGYYPPGSTIPTGNPYSGYPYSGYPYSGYPGAVPTAPPGSYPPYNGPPPMVPGAGQSATVQTNPSMVPNTYSAPGVFPSSTPSALYPGSYSSSAGCFGCLYGAGSSINPPPGSYNAGGYYPGVYNGVYGTSGVYPPGSTYSGQYGQPPGSFRLFQGPRIRHSYVHGDHAHNDVSINDTDVAIAMLLPGCGCSTQPVYILPSFSLHQWAGPRPDLSPINNADLPSKAYSAFVDVGWQSDPAQILGAELGLRVGVFSDFDTYYTRSLRVMGRTIGRLRLTPRSTLKLGAMYLDRNRVKLLPAGGILWQPNPGTRLDLFFPEPKLSSFLTTMGNFDTWWYLAGYYGGGSWTIRRADNSQDSIAINDIRITLGLEWGRNDMLRDGRRVGFFEAGYVFDRELLYSSRPGDNLELQDTFVVRAGFGY